jgi:hypothetical protein
VAALISAKAIHNASDLPARDGSTAERYLPAAIWLGLVNSYGLSDILKYHPRETSIRRPMADWPRAFRHPFYSTRNPCCKTSGGELLRLVRVIAALICPSNGTFFD